MKHIQGGSYVQHHIDLYIRPTVVWGHYALLCLENEHPSLTSFSDCCVNPKNREGLPGLELPPAFF